MNISSHFEQLIFHDAFITSVRRERDRIELIFDSVGVAQGHPATQGHAVKLLKAQLVFLQVRSEKALIWHDGISPIAHPNPSAPINEVMHGTQKENHFHFDGFWQADDWSEWFIYSNDFLLTGNLLLNSE